MQQKKVGGLQPSFQMGMILDIIDSYAREGLDLFAMLQNQVYLKELVKVQEKPNEGCLLEVFNEEEVQKVQYKIIISNYDKAEDEEELMTSETFAKSLGNELEHRIGKEVDLKTILYEALAVVNRKELSFVKKTQNCISIRGKSPELSLTILRMNKNKKIEIFTIGDDNIRIYYKDKTGEKGKAEKREIKDRENGELVCSNNYCDLEEELLRNNNSDMLCECSVLKGNYIKRHKLNLAGNHVEGGKYRVINADIVDSIKVSSFELYSAKND